MSEKRLTVWEMHILLAAVGLGTENKDRCYGASIAQYIETSTGRMVALQTIYDALDALAKKRFINTSLGPPGHERGGKARMLVSVSALGESALRQHLEELDVLRLRCGQTWGLTNA